MNRKDRLNNCRSFIYFYFQRGIKKKTKGESAAHWLDLAKDKYDDQLVEDVKMVLRVLVIFIPIPVFWALFDQTGSRWTFQATRMNGALGSTTIKPDQMQVVNPILVLFMIPAFDRIIYPAFAKCGLLVKPLQRMCAGGFLTAASFFISGFLELEMAKTYAKVPMLGEAHLHLMNNLPCHVNIRITNDTGIVSESGIEELTNLVLRSIEPNATFTVDMKVAESCLPDILTVRQAQVEVTAMEGMVTPVLLSVQGGSVKPSVIAKHDDPKKDGGANSRVRVIYDLGDYANQGNLTLVFDKKTSFTIEPNSVGGTNYTSLDIGTFE